MTKKTIANYTNTYRRHIETYRSQQTNSATNFFLPHYPEEYAFRELTQLYSFTGLHLVDNITENNNQQKTTHFSHLPQTPDIMKN